MKTFTTALSAAQDKSDPRNEAQTPSNMNGNRIVQFEAPTSRIISVSFLRDAALIRIVVPVSMIATTIITAAITSVTTVALFNAENMGSKISR